MTTTAIVPAIKFDIFMAGDIDHAALIEAARIALPVVSDARCSDK